MQQARSDSVRAAKVVVLGLGGLALLYLIGAPLVHYAAIVAAGVLLGVALWSVACGIARRSGAPYRAALTLVLVFLVGSLVAFFAWTGPKVAAQLEQLQAAVTEGVARGREWLESTTFGLQALERVDALGERLSARGAEVIGSVGRSVASGLGVLADALIVVVLGVFFAATPRRYVEGLLSLAPPARRERLREVSRATAHTLRAWLAARLFLMFVIGSAFGIALALLGVPLAFPIGVLTGALAFIPFVGAILAVVPAVAVAFVQGPEQALYVLIVYLSIQLVETNVLDPLVESHAVQLPPAMVVLAQLVAVVHFGAIGVLISTPLLVVVVVVVRMLYLEDVLGEPPVEPRKRRSLAAWLRDLRGHGPRTEQAAPA